MDKGDKIGLIIVATIFIASLSGFIFLTCYYIPTKIATFQSELNSLGIQTKQGMIESPSVRMFVSHDKFLELVKIYPNNVYFGKINNIDSGSFYVFENNYLIAYEYVPY